VLLHLPQTLSIQTEITGILAFCGKEEIIHSLSLYT